MKISNYINAIYFHQVKLNINAIYKVFPFTKYYMCDFSYNTYILEDGYCEFKFTVKQYAIL